MFIFVKNNLGCRKYSGHFAATIARRENVSVIKDNRSNNKTLKSNKFMKIASFQDMVLEYEILMIDLDSNNLELRNNLLKSFKYSFIVEGGDNEIENLLKWIDVNLQMSLENIFYGKVDYNYHFAEFFLNSEFALKSIIKVIPNIYTIYTNSYPPNSISKTNGVNNIIKYAETNTDAILYKV